MNIIEYVGTSTDTFQKRPFGEVDSLVLCQVAYLDLSNYQDACLSALAGLSDADMARIARAHVAENKALLDAFAESVRFGGVRVLCQNTLFDVSSSCQFSATVFDVTDAYFFACRGTDGTLVGWKEDLDLMYKDDIAAQTHALQCLNRIATDRPIIVGGHSKGGNLAVYAAAFCDKAVQARILAVYDHDGPGFMPAVVEREGYRRILPRVHKTVPEMCVFGHMMDDGLTYTVVKADTNNIYQHLSFNWHCMPDGFFEMSDGITVGSQIVREICDTIVPAMTLEERETFVIIVYETLRHADVDRVGDIASVKALAKALRYTRRLPKSLRAQMAHCVRLFLAAAWGSSVSVTEEYIGATLNEWRARRQEKKVERKATKAAKEGDTVTATPLVAADTTDTHTDDTEDPA